MSQESIRLVEAAFDAWNRGDLDAFADYAVDDIEWLEVSGRPESADRELRGRDRMRASLKALFDAWETYRLELERIEAVGDRVLAIVREVARGRTSGVEVDSVWGYLITVERGKLVRVEAYRDPAGALEAAGLPQP